MPRILIVECKQEVSTFNPVLSGCEDFTVRHGRAILDYHRTVRSEVGGALSVFDATPGVEPVPARSAHFITSGGTLTDAAFARIAGDILASIKAAPPVDGIYFSLHGAMATESEGDPEGWLLAETRKIVGERVAIVISLDLHGILTDRMLEHSDAAVAFHTYPHVDFFTTGARAARLLLRIVAGEVKPVTAKVTVPALVRGDELITETGSIRHAVNAAKAIEQRPGGLSAAMMWGNPFTDVPALASNSFVVTDNDLARAEGEALRIASLFWEHHEKMQVPLTSLADAARIAREIWADEHPSPHPSPLVRRGERVPEGRVRGVRVRDVPTTQDSSGDRSSTVVLVDAADATSSGASGDSNAILRALLDAGYEGTALIPIVDAAAVAAAFKAGVGNTVKTTVGGALDKRRFTPLPIEGRVRMLSDGWFHSETTRELWQAGRTAVIQFAGFTLIVTSRAVSLYDRALFLAHGCDPRRFGAVVVKSPHCEPHMFKAWAARYVDVDAPGSTSANLKSLGHTKCARPIFPLDADVKFTSQVKLFRGRWS
ncbi:MAG: M81 family metallopeptidase [Verrucomicrobia bacterium]|nr:M81 family metallopeptidase [Verrucomicrobiota bacterium]